jgi:hypothetical protein
MSGGVLPAMSVDVPPSVVGGGGFGFVHTPTV